MCIIIIPSICLHTTLTHLRETLCSVFVWAGLGVLLFPSGCADLHTHSKAACRLSPCRIDHVCFLGGSRRQVNGTPQKGFVRPEELLEGKVSRVPSTVAVWDRAASETSSLSVVRMLRPSTSGCVSSSWSSTRPTSSTQDMMYPPSAGWPLRCVTISILALLNNSNLHPLLLMLNESLHFIVLLICSTFFLLCMFSHHIPFCCMMSHYIISFPNSSLPEKLSQCNV